MELKDYRLQLDRIDNQLLSLFVERMNISAEIAVWKQKNNLPVLDARREKEKLRQMEEQSPEELSEYTIALFSLIMELSRSRQNRQYRQNRQCLRRRKRTGRLRNGKYHTGWFLREDCFYTCFQSFLF